ncbi:MAG: hypothetical protein IJR82_05685 [Bacilli bacterium]|nr:hypothetical protein [Bacilli bacterium]
MIKLSELQYGIEIPLHDKVYEMSRQQPNKPYRHSLDGKWPDYQLMTTIEKTRDKEQNLDIYVIRLLRLKNGNQKDEIVGFLYFSYDKTEKKSAFYGIKVRDSFRNKGISNYFIARWADICIQNDVENLYTISKQRKPILIYSLKKISFELEDTSLYNQGHNIVVCKNVFNNKKGLYFENDNDRQAFASSTINKETPHFIIPKLSDKYEQLATLLLENPYFAQDLNLISNFSEETIETFPDTIRKK